MTLKFEQNPKKLWHGMTREDTRRHSKARARGHGMFPTHQYSVMVDSDRKSLREMQCYQHYTTLDIDLISYNNFPLCLGYSPGGHSVVKNKGGLAR